MKSLLIILLMCTHPIFSLSHQQEPLEIELKFKIPAEISEQFKRNLELQSGQIVNMDEIYFMGLELQPVDSNGYKRMPHYLRLRKTNKGSFITLKKRGLAGVIEYETRLDNPAMMENILEALGYGTNSTTKVHITKQRTKHTLIFEGMLVEIVFDTFASPEHMKNMGEFIEVELKSDAPSYQEGIAILKRFLLSYGITHIDKYPPYIEIAINQNCDNQIEKIDIIAEL